MIVIPGYESLEELYKSHRSLVYRAKCESDGKAVVLKILNGEYPEPRQIAYFKREYGIVRELVSQRVIEAERLEKFKNSYMIVLEDVGAKSLDHLFPLRDLDLEMFLKLAIDLAEALSDIHRQNIVHKDMNPSNILWNPESGQLKLIDFGISTKLSREMPNVLNPNVLEGTLAYISPEQTGRMNRGIDYRSDFYSLGATFYALLTKQLPFDSDDPVELIHCHIAKTPIPPSELNPGIPGILSEIILKLMAKNAEKRYQSAFGLKRDLEKCLEQYRHEKTLSDFVLGEQDVSEKFQVTQKLYGREMELELLSDHFELACQGSRVMIFVSGYAGVGKSVLVHEIQKTIEQQHGYFLEGKCDQFRQNIPYEPFIKAFRHLIAQLLSESEEELKSWKERLEQALGVNAQLMVDLIPQLGQILGKQAAVPDMSPTEAQNRFLATFRHFVAVFAKAEHPLCVFLDDLQWADIPTLSLLEQLLKSREIRHLFLIGAYRNNEVNEGHPLALTLGQLQEIQSIRQLVLSPLDERSVAAIVADSLCDEPENVSELAELVYRKTRGNPLFVNELLNNVYQEEMLFFDSVRRKWRWNVEQIDASNVSEHAVDFMIYRLKKLPVNTQKALQLASCIGNEFDLKVLGIIAEQSSAELGNALWPAVREGALLPLNAEYQLLSVQEESADETISAFDVSYRFRHDRIQQAAYALLPEDEKAGFHLRIGRLLQEQLPPEEREERALEIVSQVNEGRQLIDDPQERLELARLNLSVGEKAISSVAYQPALQYLNIAKELLPENCWETYADLSAKVYRKYSECAYLCGEFDSAEQHCHTLLEHVGSSLEQTEIRCMQLIQYGCSRKFDEAIRVGILGLELLGISISATPSKTDVLKALLEAKWHLGRRRIADLAERPLISAPEVRLSMKMLDNFITPSYLTGNANLFALVVLKETSLALRHGNSPESAKAFAGYAVLLAGLGDLKRSYEFGKLSLELNEHFNDLQSKCRALTLYTIFCQSWKHHWKTLSALYKQAIDAGLQSGDFLNLSHCSCYVTLWNPELTLPEAIEEGRKYMALIQETYYQDALDMAEIFQALRLKLSSESPGTISLPGEAERLERMMLEGFISGVAQQHIMELQACFFYEEYAKALLHIEEAQKVIPALMGTLFVAELNFFAFLTIAAVLPQQAAGEQKSSGKRLHGYYKQMKKWAKYAPVNFEHRRLLMEAEQIRLFGKFQQAVPLYERAVKTAKEQGFLRDEALCNEVAARFYLGHDIEKIALAYMREAHYGYAHWGAHGKVAALEQKFPQLLRASAKGTTRTWTTGGSKTSSSSSDMTGGTLDFRSVLKAGQAISSEIVLETLLKSMTAILSENAGAERGMLLFHHQDGIWKVEVAINDREAAVLEPLALQQTGDSFAAIPTEQLGSVSGVIINYVTRSGESLILHDASSEGKYSQDAHIKEHAVKSVLCMPLQHMGKRYGVLYLENNLVSHAFTEERIEVLQALLAQAAISIENAGLYTRVEQSEKKYRSIFENAVEGIFQTSLEGRVLNANPALARILGYDSSQELLSSLTDLETQFYVNPDDRKTILGVLEREKEVIGFEAQVYKKDRSPTWVAISSRSVEDKHAKLLYFEGSLLDITARKQTEQAERARELAEAGREKIVQSIRYAEMIQRALLPNVEALQKCLPENFVLWQPRDIVGGDIFVAECWENSFLIAVFDCTGHGVPGAFMTMLAISNLKRILSDEACREPAMILQRLNVLIKTTLHQDSSHALSDDGLDAAICVVRPNDARLTFAGARLPLYVVERGELRVIKGDKTSVGYKRSPLDAVFTNHELPLGKGMSLYLATDGFSDQVGGPKGIPFGKKRFAHLLKKAEGEGFERQKEMLLQVLTEYQGEHERRDDVTVLGFTASKSQ